MNSAFLPASEPEPEPEPQPRREFGRSEPGRADATRALVRDEGRLRAAIETHGDRIHDPVSNAELQHRLEDVLESVRGIALDDDLWVRLEEGATLPHARKAVEELAEFAWFGLPPLMQTVGYRSPPRPSALELVQNTVAAIADAAEADVHDASARVAEARRRLLAMRLRVRRDLDLAPEVARPSVLRRAARTSADISRQLVPVAVAAATSVGLESLVPGSGLAGLGATWAVKVGEKWVELMTSHILGGGLDVPAYDEEPPARRHLARMELPDVAPAHEHAVALEYALDRVSGAVHGPAEELTRHLADARRHYDRLLVLDDRPLGWCAHHERLGQTIRRLEQLACSPRPCPSIVDAAGEARDVANRLRQYTAADI